LDFWKKEKGTDFKPAEDPGVRSAAQIFNYYKKFGYKTIVMGASFRSKEEVLELSGCDFLTVSPKLLQELSKSTDPIPRKLDCEKAKSMDLKQIHLDEKGFRWLHGTDPCGTAKLAEGIVKFAEDSEKLEKVIRGKLST